MAITKNYVNEMFRTVLVLSALLSAASAVDCNGKSFHCVNSTHFMICVDLGEGVSQAIDNFFIACPPPTVCQGTNHLECEFPAPTTAATTLTNVISETTLPWEEVVTASSLGNATKEFSENYINTERITTTVEYSVTTDAYVDWTAINASELNIYNEMNTPEIEPTLAAEIATTAMETNQTVNENVNTTEYVPTVGDRDITTAIIKNVSQTTTESQNFIETDPVVVDEITATAVETTTENIIITDTTAAEIEYVAPSVTEQIAQTINENLNITETVPSGVENVTQKTTESKNLTETEPVVVDEITATAVETTTENIIITDTTAAEIEYVAPSAIEVAQTSNENLNITETVQTGVENVTQTTTESKNLTEMEPVVVDEITVTAVETTTENIIVTDTTAAEIEYVAPSATEQIAQTINENLNITETVPTGVENVTQTTTESKNLTEMEPVVVDEITATAVETTTENIIRTDTTAAEIEYVAPSATEQIAQTINENLNIKETVPTGVENVTQTTTKSTNLTETKPVVVDEITATAAVTTTETIIITDTTAAEIEYVAPSATEQIPQTINESLNITKTVPTGVENVTQTTTESTNLTETEPVVVDNITIVETTTENIIITDTLAAEINNIALSAIEQVAHTIDENLFITETMPTSVENVTQTSTESKNLTETEPVVVDGITATTIETTTENIVITDTIAAEIDYITPSATEQVPQTINQNMNTTETVPLKVNKDITTTIIKTVTQTTAGSGILTQTEHVETYEITATTIETKTDNIFTPDSLGLELGYTEPTATEQVTHNTNGNMLELETVQSNSLIEEIITTDTTQNIVTENIIPPTQAVNIGTINKDAFLTAVTNVQSIPPAFEDNMKFEILTPVTENIESTVNNGASTNGFATAQPVNVDTINTEAIYIPITITSAPPLAPAFDDNMSTDVPLPTIENVESSVNNGATTNGLTTAHTVNVDNINAEAMYIPTTTAQAVKVIIKKIPNTIIQETQIILSSSTDTGVKLDAIESDVNESYNDNNMTSIDTNNMFEIEEQLIINNIPNSTVDSSVDKSVSHVSQTGPGETDNSLFPNAHYNQNEVTSAINEVTHSNGKPTAEDVNEKAPVNNVAISQTGPSPKSISGNTANITTTTSIPTSGFDSTFDISNQNWTSQQGESKTKQATNNLQPSIVEHNDQADNIIWNPLANEVFNNPNQTPESIGTSNVTNINDNTNDRNAASLNSQSEIPVNLKPVDFATTGTDVSSLPTTLPAKMSDADITIRDNIKITYKPIEHSVKPPSGSSVVEADNNRKSPENMQALSNQDPPVASISITSDIKPEVKSSIVIVKDGNSDSPTVAHNNLPSQSIMSQFELTTITHSFSEATSIGTPMEGNKVINEDDTMSKTVMLDLLPLPINNIKFSAHTATKPVLMDFNSNSHAENTPIITELYKSETLKPIFAETGIQDSGHGGDITPVPRIREPAFNFQIGITDRTSGTTTTVPTVAGSTSNSQTSGVAKTGSSAAFNSQTRVNDGADVLAQQVEKIPNTMTSAPNNAHVVPGPKPSGSGIITNNPDNLHSPNSSNIVVTGIITPESVSASNYESPMSENITPQIVVIGYQKNNTKVVAGLNVVSQNVSFGTNKGPPNAIGSDHIQTQQSNPSTKNSTSIFTPAQKISTSTARTPSQMATSNPISHLKNNLTKQVPTVAAHTFSCIYGIRGRYSDKGDCRKFYICIGNNEPIVGYCPENTVFSDLKKLCTKNMSHCIRENQFKCPSVGRFSDFLKDNVYYICVNHKDHLYRFKFQCQKGYILDKTTIKCIETKEIESNESVSISSDNSRQTSSSAISSSTSSKSVSSTSSTSKSSSRADDSRGKNDNSSKSKSNEAKETSERSEGKDDDGDDEVFKCKERGKFPIHNECRRYYLCKKGRRSEYRRKIKKCDSDQVFHQNKKKCVDEDSYEC